MLAFAWLAACAPLGDVPDVPVDAAWLERLDSDQAALIVGYVGGDALLVYEATDGYTGAVPVAVNGGSLGVVFALDLDLSPGETVPLDFSDADPDLRLPDLLGTYTGTGWGVAAGLGGQGARMRNGAGVRLATEDFVAGVAVDAALEWVRIRVGGDEGAPLDTFGRPDSAVDTSDTARDDTAKTADTARPVDTGSTPSGGGCGGGRPRESRPASESPHPGCGCHGSGCDGDLCCATSNALEAPLVFVLLGGWLRRRRGATILAGSSQLDRGRRG